METPIGAISRVILLAIAPVFLLVAGAPGVAAAADCAQAIAFAATVVDYGQRAMASQDYYTSGNLASEARIPAIDAARSAKACGCPDAIPLLAEAARDAARSNSTANLTASQQYGAAIAKRGEAAIAALRSCASR
jgi:hypothetical protein